MPNVVLVLQIYSLVIIISKLKIYLCVLDSTQHVIRSLEKNAYLSCLLIPFLKKSSSCQIWRYPQCNCKILSALSIKGCSCDDAIVTIPIELKEEAANSSSRSMEKHPQNSSPQSSVYILFNYCLIYIPKGATFKFVTSVKTLYSQLCNDKFIIKIIN